MSRSVYHTGGYSSKQIVYTCHLLGRLGAGLKKNDGQKFFFQTPLLFGFPFPVSAAGSLGGTLLQAMSPIE